MNDPERLLEEGSETEKLILHSAALDEPGRRLSAHILASLGEEAVIHRPNFYRSKVFTFGVVAAAAMGLLYLGTLAGSPKTVVLFEAESPLDSTRAAGTPSAPAATKAAAAPVALSGSRLDPCLKAPRAAGKQPRVDGIDLRQIKSREVEGRFGTWFVENDSSGIQHPPEASDWNFGQTDNADSPSLTTTGSAFKNWGASIGITFAGGGCYNAGVYRGIEFVATGSARLNVAVQTIDVVPVEEGGTCTVGCYANHRKVVQLSGKEQTYRVLFSDLQQHEFGKKSAFDSGRLRSVIFQVASEDTPFEFSVSQVSFFVQ